MDYKRLIQVYVGPQPSWQLDGNISEMANLKSKQGFQLQISKVRQDIKNQRKDVNNQVPLYEYLAHAGR